MPVRRIVGRRARYVSSPRGERIPSNAEAGRLMRNLERQLATEFRKREAQRARTATALRRIHAPLVELVSRDPRAAQAIGVLRRLHERPPRRRLRVPDWVTVTPRLFTGSFLWIEIPPYDFRWTWQDVSGRPFVRAAADATAGTMSVQVRAGEAGGSADARAAVGIYFRPPQNGFLQFRALTVFNFHWQALSYGDLSAHTDGWIGLVAIDGTEARLAKQQIPLWWRDLDSLWGENTGDAGDASWLLSAEFPVVGGRSYFLWVWCGAYATGSGKRGIAGSGALAELFVKVPFMAVDYHG